MAVSSQKKSQTKNPEREEGEAYRVFGGVVFLMNVRGL